MKIKVYHTAEELKSVPELYEDANKYVHFEYSTDKREVEIYIGGYFLSSVLVKDISKEAGQELFKEI